MNFVNTLSNYQAELNCSNNMALGEIRSFRNIVAKYQRNFSSIKVLVVEDTEICQKIALQMLNQLKYKTDLAVTGKEALEKFQQGCDVILMDLNLPDMSGIDICREIRKKRSAIDLPIIAYSTISDSLYEECLNAGFNDALMKPAEKRVLDEIIKNLVKKNSMRFFINSKINHSSVTS